MMKEKIKQRILEQFAATNSRVGHCVDERWILHKLKPTLNPKEQDQINAAIQELVADGLITLEQPMGLPAMALTQKRFDHIYPG